MTEGEHILYTAEEGTVNIQLDAEGELQPEATCKRHLHVRWEGARQVKRALTHAGKLRADVVEKLALERYENFDAARLAADVEDMAALEQAGRQLEGKGRGKKK